MNDEIKKHGNDPVFLKRGPGTVIYNVTVKVKQQIAGEWLTWLFNEYIAAVMQTHCFIDYKVVRLLETDDSDGPTYAVQYTANSKADYDRYMDLYAAEMRRISFEKWSEHFIAFGSVMEVVK